MISQSYTFVGYCLSDALTKVTIFEKKNVTFTTFEFFFQPGSLVNVPKDHIRSITSSFRLSILISKVLIKPEIVWQWLYVVYPHFAPRDQTF